MLEKDKIINVQAPMPESKMLALKLKTKENAIKDALTVAVDAYLEE